LKGWDYRRPGFYFVTVCTQNREHLFGEIINGKMVLNEFGNVVSNQWKKIPNHFPTVRLDAFVVMPDHIHGILHIVERVDGPVGAKHSGEEILNNQSICHRNASPLQCNRPIRPRGTKPGSLSSVMQNYLSVTTRKINQIRGTPGSRVWQRNYYDQIIWNDDLLKRIRKYIRNNPMKWTLKHGHSIKKDFSHRNSH